MSSVTVPERAPGLAPRSHPLKNWWEGLAVLVLTLVAAFLRFYRLDLTPPGFHFDEAYEAVEALRVLQTPGYHPIFFTGNFGVEPIFIYLTALAFRLAGATPLAMRTVSAVLGTLTVPALWVLAREMRQADPSLPRCFPLASAAALAGLRWHLHFSRLGIEPVLVPLVATLSFALLWRGVRRGGFWPWVGAGLLLGLSPYTYPAGRLLPVLFLAVVSWGVLCHRAQWLPCWRGLVLAASVAGLVVAPLLVLFARQPELLTLRASQVAVAGREASSVGLNTLRTLGMFFVEGDLDPRNNLPGEPVLDPWLAAPFCVGLLLALWRGRRPAWASILLWLGVMLLPTALSEYAPHFRRAIGAAPATAMLAGLGAAALVQWASRRALLSSFPPKTEEGKGCPPLTGGGGERLREPNAAPSSPFPLLAAALLVLALWGGSLASTAQGYFVRWAHDPALFYAFDVGLWRLGQTLRMLEGKGVVYLSPRSPAHYTLAFALWGSKLDIRSFDGRYGLVLPGNLQGQDIWYAVITHEDWRFPLLVERFLPGAVVEQRFLDDDGRTYALLWRAPPGGLAEATPGHIVDATLGEGIALRGYDLEPGEVRPGESVYITLYWQALGPVPKDYTVFTHLLGPPNPQTGGPVWAGHDGEPGGGSYPTSRWRAGEWVLDQHELQVPADAPPGTYPLEAGLYLLETGERLPARMGDVVDDRVLLGEVRVTE